MQNVNNKVNSENSWRRLNTYGFAVWVYALADIKSRKSSNPATLEVEGTNGVGSIPVDVNSPSISGLIEWPAVRQQWCPSARGLNDVLVLTTLGKTFVDFFTF